MMQAALQRLALPLITGAEWAIFRGAHKSITQLNNNFSPGPSSIYKGQGIWWPG
jgi:hypothetical protein